MEEPEYFWLIAWWFDGAEQKESDGTELKRMRFRWTWGPIRRGMVGFTVQYKALWTLKYFTGSQLITKQYYWIQATSGKLFNVLTGHVRLKLCANIWVSSSQDVVYAHQMQVLYMSKDTPMLLPWASLDSCCTAPFTKSEWLTWMNSIQVVLHSFSAVYFRARRSKLFARMAEDRVYRCLCHSDAYNTLPQSITGDTSL